MSLLDYWSEGLKSLQQSQFYRGAEYIGLGLVGFIAAVLVLLLITILLRRFVRNHPLINRAHRVLIYLLTMSGVTLLVLAGILGLVLPIIPGIPLLLAGLLLMRKYHKWHWLEEKIARFKHRVRKYRKERQRRKELRRRDEVARPTGRVRQNRRGPRQHSDKL